MKKIPLTRGKFAIIDNDDFKIISRHKWCYHAAGGGYAARAGSRRGNTILMHRVILGVRPGFLTDHKNGNGLDNRKQNLRICSHSENLRNRKLNKNNSSGAKGVSKRGNRWIARIQLGNRPFELGYYSTFIEARAAYDAAARVLHGRFARPNLDL